MKRDIFKAVAMAALGLSALAPLALADAPEVVIGISTAVTGPAAALGVPERNALAVEPTEIGGVKLKVIFLDDAGDPATATTNARRFVSEDKVDVMVGSAITPTTIAMSNVAFENNVPLIGLAPIPLPPEKSKWTVDLPQPVGLMAKGLIAHMKAKGVHNLGFIGYSDSYGDLWLKAFKEQGEAAGIKIVDEERFARADTSVAGQALKLAATKPDAILVAASGTAAALPNIDLRDKGYDGPLYQTHGAVTYDFIKIAGKAAEGTILAAGPPIIAEQLPDSALNKKVAVAFVTAYEAKYGPASRSQFAAHMNDVFEVLKRVVPAAMKTAKPGTPEFRDAIRANLEGEKEIIAAQGIYNFTPTDRYGTDDRAYVIITVKDGKFVLVK